MKICFSPVPGFSVQIVLAWADKITYILVRFVQELTGVEEANGGPTPSFVLVHELPHLAAQATLHDHHPAAQLPGQEDIIRQYRYTTERQRQYQMWEGGTGRWDEIQGCGSGS